MSKQLGFEATDYEQWYQVTKADFIRLRGRGLLQLHNDSVHQLLQKQYPSYDWLPFKFVNTPKNYWRDIENQKKYMVWLQTRLGIKEARDWYRINKLDFIDNYGNSLLLLHGGSPAQVVMALIDNAQGWQVWRFANLPRAAHKDPEVLRQFLEFAARHYEIKDQPDWYRLSWSQIRDIGGFSLVKRNGGFCQSLAQVYPEQKWNPRQFNTPGKKSSQRLLKLYLTRLFGDHEVIEEYRDLARLRYTNSTNFGFQLDFYIPSLNVAFEYQGKQHFQDTRLYGDAKIYRDRDAEKRVICNQLSIKLIDIPYWWDNQIDSLIGTIIEHGGRTWLDSYITKHSTINGWTTNQHFQRIPIEYQKQRTNKKVHSLL
ncbi:hypothetical protein SAMD00019534_009160 [Acytostelium subglobosum LB1]|uniref:hypothetical protein n=1 Tax=Acytostelium subglobosum LB1 TaxID=1410327 RepID=UPI000644DD32|nr:hypothetical protein SAMD00019534_009160 [Acytostelium subglobosum LB1]GAM17741.1 hypothetical protein SAMD00019534_009160 [Acytostelium subglobosum LB1]|eukprot:XP_012758337.1 hypothetical protein SAMD00019534_009160 [Acytostelium subglobosum LB1]